MGSGFGKALAMIGNFFNHSLVNLHYYKFGQGRKVMLCFHGYGMHGRQFKILEESLGNTYTFYGFDLFFHEGTKLIDQSLKIVKQGITKKQFCDLIVDFCEYESIDKFSVIGYSMGSYFASALVEDLPKRIIEYIVAAPSCLKPGATLVFLSGNRIGNKILEKLALSDQGMFKMLKVLRQLRIVDEKGHEILQKEFATPELRFNFYASATYFKLLKTDMPKLISGLNGHSIKSIFIFGKRDGMYPESIGNKLIPKLQNAEKLILDSNHDLIKQEFALKLSALLL